MKKVKYNVKEQFLSRSVGHNAINLMEIKLLTPPHRQIPDRSPGQASRPEEPEKTGFLLSQE